MAVLLSLHKSIFTLLARNRPVYCKVRYERKADVVRFGTELNLLTALWACQISPVFNCLCPRGWLPEPGLRPGWQRE